MNSAQHAVNTNNRDVNRVESDLVKALLSNRRVPVQTLLDARPGLGTQRRYEAAGDLRVEN